MRAIFRFLFGLRRSDGPLRHDLLKIKDTGYRNLVAGMVNAADKGTHFGGRS